jgi:hypothetical protein
MNQYQMPVTKPGNYYDLIEKSGEWDDRSEARERSALVDVLLRGALIGAVIGGLRNLYDKGLLNIEGFHKITDFLKNIDLKTIAKYTTIGSGISLGVSGLSDLYYKGLFKSKPYLKLLAGLGLAALPFLLSNIQIGKT